jgi:LysM repeat protein
MRAPKLIARHRRKNGARGVALALLAAAAVCACAQVAQVESGIRETFDEPRAPARHEVRPGENLRSIAAGYGTTVEQLARANNLRPTDRVAPGRRLVIPGGARIVYYVKRGDSLEAIAARHRVRVSTISSENRLGRYPQLRVGQRLVMPREAKLPPPPGALAAQPPSAPAVSAAPPQAVAAAPPAPARAADPNLERASALVDRAVADYRGAHFERAIEHAEQAEALVADSESRDARRIGARSVFVAGSALAALGDTDRAKASFARVHALDPEFEPPKGWLSPRLEKLYLAAREE